MEEVLREFASASIILKVSGLTDPEDENYKNLTFANAVEKPTKDDLAVFKAAIEAFTGGVIEVTRQKTIHALD